MDAQWQLVGVNTTVIGAQVGMAVPLYLVEEFLKEWLETKGWPRI